MIQLGPGIMQSWMYALSKMKKVCTLQLHYFDRNLDLLCLTGYWIRLCLLFFSIRVFFQRHWTKGDSRFTGQQGKGGDYLSFHSATSIRSRTFRHIFATLHVRWLSRIFNSIACFYQTATRWDLTTLLNYHLIG